MQPIQIDYNNLHNLSSDYIKQAYGKDSLGILIIDNIPNISKLRNNIFIQMKQFAELSEEIQNNYIDISHSYSFGWSRGKEKMSSGVYDFLKGSYYFNPLEENLNIWPDDIIPNFKNNAIILSKIIIEISKEILKMCDQYISEIYPNSKKLFNIVTSSSSHKARLLHYYPIEEKNEINQWCGMHNDHSIITGLVAPLYYDSDYNIVNINDANCGLFIKSNDEKLIKIDIPENSVAFQIGESSCIFSGGILRPTPHVVIAPTMNTDINRNTMAVFLSPDPSELMIKPVLSNMSDIFNCSLISDNVPTLESRWSDGISYNEFSERTFKAYYY